jgi:hypothetical protein
MNIYNIIESNTKLENIMINNSTLFIGSPILNCQISLSMVNDIKKKKMDNEDTIIENNALIPHNMKSISKINNFIVYKHGYYFFNFEPTNSKLEYLSPYINSLNANILTSILSVRIIKNNNYNIKYINEEITKDFFRKIFKKDLNLFSLIRTNYYNFFINNNLINNIYNYHKKVKNPEYVDILINLLKTDIKCNFMILLILKFNNNICTQEIYELYDYLWDNLEDLRPTKESINSHTKKELVTNENFNFIIKTWFIYIDLEQNLINLMNICGNIEKFTEEELNGKSVNKNKIINKYINYVNCENKLNNFKTILN